MIETPSANHQSDADICDRLVLEFAQSAARSGWTHAALHDFRMSRGLPATGSSFPSDVRSVARSFNSLADAQTEKHIRLDGMHRLSDVLAARFADNEQHKASVVQLARSDLFHPVDTLVRTAQTAAIMLSAAGARPSRFRTYWLALLYSACVLIWLGDRQPYRRLTRACRLAAFLAGAD